MPNENVVAGQFADGEVRRKKGGELFFWNGSGWQSLAGVTLTWQEGDDPWDTPLVPEGTRDDTAATEQFTNLEMRLTKDGEYAIWIAAHKAWQSLAGCWVSSRNTDGSLGPPPRDLPLVPDGARVVRP